MLSNRRKLIRPYPFLRICLVSVGQRKRGICKPWYSHGNAPQQGDRTQGITAKRSIFSSPVDLAHIRFADANLLVSLFAVTLSDVSYWHACSEPCEIADAKHA